MKFFRKGFTLVELLVVISIIGILVGVVAVNSNAARRQSRDAKRKADIQNVAGALELYRAEHHFYPNPSPANGLNSTPVTDYSGLAAALLQYTSNVPSAPQNGSAYYYFSDGNRFVLEAQLENSSEAATFTLNSPRSPSDPAFYSTGVYKNGSDPANAYYRVSGP